MEANGVGKRCSELLSFRGNEALPRKGEYRPYENGRK